MDHRHFLGSLFDPSSVVLVVEGDEVPGWVATIRDGLAGAQVRSAVCRLADGDAVPEGSFELALLAVPQRAARPAIAMAARLGAKAVVVLTERSDPGDAAAWADAARAARVRMLGPATMGFARPSRGLDAGRMGGLPLAGNVALVSQSGVLNAAILDWAHGSRMGFSLAVSLGAESDVDVAQVLDFLAADGLTKAVVVYLEAVKDARSFMSALRALATVKPVVVLKGGRDEGARQRARTHSGAIVGGDAIYSAALRRAGAVQIRLFTQLFTAARYLATRTWPIGKRLAVISNGNGPAVLAADQAWFQRIRLLPFAGQTRDVLREAVPHAAPENPFDMGMGAQPAHYEAAISAIAADPESDAILVLMSPHGGADVEGITAAVARAAARPGKPLFACWLGESGTRPSRARLDAAGLPAFRTPEAAVDAFSTVATFYQNQLLLQQTPRPLSGLEPPDIEGARMVIDAALTEGRDVLTEMESKALLGAFHIPVTRTVVARSAAEAVVLAEQLGFPLAMKVSSIDVSHKSDVGGVVLNVRNAAEVRAQYAEIAAAVRAAQPGARIEGVTLQAMKRGASGRELYVGVFRDRLFGPVIAFGAGGTRVEIVRDTALEFPPLNAFLARSLIERTRVATTLGEFRGLPAADIEALETVLVRVSEMVCELPQIAEMDINPVIADEHGAIAVDARIVIDRAADRFGQRHGHMAIMPYPAHLTRERTMRDGRYYTIRAIQAEDADRLQRFVRGLSEQSRYFRFISTLVELPPRMLVRYTQIDYDRELALVATLSYEAVAADPSARCDMQPGDECIAGVVRYLLNPDRETCEFAIAVGDAYQGQGLGTTLMSAIIEAARAKGLKRIEGYVLAANAPMLKLMRGLGFAVERDPDDDTMKLVSLVL